MMEPATNQFVLGQRYTLATLALVIGLLSFLNLAGVEKAVLAIVLGMRALSLRPQPALQERRVWAKSGRCMAKITGIGGVFQIRRRSDHTNKQ